MPKIALIRRGQCFFNQKLLYAQLDGAIGAIVYDNVSFADDPLATYGMVWQYYKALRKNHELAITLCFIISLLRQIQST